MTRTGKTILAICAVAAVGGAAFAASGPHRGDRGAALFERFDADGDGAISRAEVDATHKARFMEADANGDGAVDLKELTTAMTKRAEEHAARMMERADANADGRIDPDEADHGRRHTRFFDRLDADGDGMITKAEAEEARRHFRRHGGRHGDHHGGDRRTE